MPIKFFLIILFISINSFGQLTPPTNLQSYYSNVDFSLAGTHLYNNLATETISKHTNILAYSERHNYLYNADQDLSNSTNVILVYNSESRSKTEYQSTNNPNSTQTFNTEHIYPQGFLDTGAAKGDLFSLRSCDISINSSRQNKPFADSSSSTYQDLGSSWFPGNNWKGDVARMIMYQNLRYNEPFTDVGPLLLFLKWNAEDPIDDFEINRNQYISTIQGNRNPFIDNPYIANLIWGTPSVGNTQNRWQVLALNEYDFSTIKVYPNPTKGNNLFVKTKELSSVKIYNVLGKLIVSDTVNITKSKIDISSIKKGIYLLKIIQSNKTLIKKIIKI